MASKKAATITVEIKSWVSGSVLFAALIAANTHPSLRVREAVVAAVKAQADLAGANLSRANLAGAYLAGAYLAGADLAGANLAGADLAGANLAGADLAGADLAGANLAGADLAGANLSRANLAGAYLAGAKSFDKALCHYQIPQEGELIVWKKVRGGLCKLRVPPEAKRTATPIGRKCRAEWVEVLEAPEDGRARHDASVVYRAGKTVRPDSYNGDPRLECTNGIHFFLTREEAEEY